MTIKAYKKHTTAKKHSVSGVVLEIETENGRLYIPIDPSDLFQSILINVSNAHGGATTVSRIAIRNLYHLGNGNYAIRGDDQPSVRRLSSDIGIPEWDKCIRCESKYNLHPNDDLTFTCSKCIGYFTELQQQMQDIAERKVKEWCMNCYKLEGLVSQPDGRHICVSCLAKHYEGCLECSEEEYCRKCDPAEEDCC